MADLLVILDSSEDIAIIVNLHYNIFNISVFFNISA